jgi:archaeal flagellin FlaB
MGKILRLRIDSEQKGITGLETAIILIAFVVVASVFAYSVLSAGLFTADKSRETIYSALEEVQGSLELRGDVLGYKDTLNAGGSGSLGKVEITVTEYSNSGQMDLTPSYTITPGSGALTSSNPNANRLQILFVDQNTTVSDCPWTVAFIGRNNGDTILDPAEKAVITVWLHTWDGAIWGPPGSEGSQFLGNNFVDTFHTFSLELKPAKGSTFSVQRTTPAHLDSVNNLH